jgi:hypothetical protein
MLEKFSQMEKNIFLLESDFSYWEKLISIFRNQCHTLRNINITMGKSCRNRWIPIRKDHIIFSSPCWEEIILGQLPTKSHNICYPGTDLTSNSTKKILASNLRPILDLLHDVRIENIIEYNYNKCLESVWQSLKWMIHVYFLMNISLAMHFSYIKH